MSSKTTGNLYINTFKEAGDKKPKYTGTLEITREQIQDMIADGKAGKEVKLKIGCWEYDSKKVEGQIYLFLVAEAGSKYEKKENSGWGNDSVPF